jgi:large subunit ribosomal protein L18e
MPASNPVLRHTSVMLERAARDNKAAVWQVASELLSAPSKNRVEINLGRLSRIAKPGEAVLVPGKVLGTGLMDKKVVVGAFSFSANARSKIEASGGSALSVEQFVKKFPKGTGVKIVE